MSSRSLIHWQTFAQRSLDEIEAAHAAIGGKGPGRRYATQQINHAYVVLLSSHFQAFSRSLHSEAIDALATPIVNPVIRAMFHRHLTLNRKLDIGNPNPGNLGSDFARFDLDFWPGIIAADPRHGARKARLERLNAWRNAIAHQAFDPKKLAGQQSITLAPIRQWRQDCAAVAVAMNDVVADHVATIVGTRPW